MNFIFINLILLIFIYSSYSNNDTLISFDIKFVCGNEPANGRFMLCLRQGQVLARCTKIVDVLIKNGTFKKDILVNFPYIQIDRFEANFRTNCHVLNRLDECCAHNFKFISCYSLFYGKQVCNRKLNENNCRKENSWISSDYSEGEKKFNFKMFDPKTKENFINLKNLLLNTKNYEEWFMMKGCNIIQLTKVPSYFQLSRSCLKKNNIQETIPQNEGFEEMEICDHPNYGL